MRNPSRIENIEHVSNKQTFRVDLLLSASFFSTLTHMFYHFNVLGLTQDTLNWVVLLGVFLVLLSVLKYVSTVHPFWRIQAAPTFKPFIFFLRGLVLCSIAVGVIYVRNQYMVQLNHWLLTSSLYSSLVVAIAGFYDFYVYFLIKRMQNAGEDIDKKSRSSSGVLDTGKLDTEGEIKRRKMGVRGGIFLGKHKNQAIFYNHAVHSITYGQPGCGKTTGSVIPNLIQWQGSAFVIDVKGELAVQTAQYRQQVLGQKIIYINPWHLHNLPNTPFNPLQLLIDDVSNTKSATAPQQLKNMEFDDAEAICNALIPEPPQASGDNKWVRDDARTLIKAFLLYLSAEYLPECDLVTLRNMLSLSDEDFEQFLKEMMLCDGYEGEISRLANVIMSNFKNSPQSFANGKNEAVTALRLYSEASALGKCVQGSTFSMGVLKETPTTIYLMVTKEYISSHGSWMGLLVTNALEAIGRTKPEHTQVLMMMDEFANLGKLPTVANALATYRGYGLRAWLIVQNKSQLKKVYGVDEAQSLEQLCNVEQYLTVGADTAKELSERIGNKTVKVSQFGGNDSDFTRTYFRGEETVTEQSIPILSIADITNLNDQQLVFVDGAPLLLEKCPYWLINPWYKHVSPNPLVSTKQSPSKRKKMIKIK